MIDTKQTFRNGTASLPDSDTRVDAELANDSLTAIVQIETTLGANVQGAYGSVAARLDALEAGGTGGIPLTNVVAFTDQTVVSLPGTAHQQGQQALSMPSMMPTRPATPSSQGRLICTPRPTMPS